MSAERQQILQMLRDGKLTAEEAQELLAALESVSSPAVEPKPKEEEVLTGEVIRPAEPPDMDRFRRFWQYPFFITLAIFLVSGLILRSLYQSSEGAITFWFFCVWTIFVLAFILTALAFLSRRSAWIHVRVRERGGRRIAISLPLPLGLAAWGINLARGFVPDAEQGNLDVAAEYVRSARDGFRDPGAEPLMINVDDEDGDQVQIFIG